MAPTIKDLFEFMRKDKEERAREREKDKQELKELITQGVQNEVRGLLNPLEDRVQSMENSQTNVISQLREVTEEVKVLREQMQTQSRVEDDHRAAPRQHQGLSEEVPRSSSYSSENISSDQIDKIREIAALARRTVGLDRIDQSDLERMRQTQFGGATNVEEEKLLAVQEYLRCELKIGNEVQQTMEIENIFPAFGVNPTHLYVTFKQESSVTRIYEKTRIMKHGSRIINFVPRQFKDRSRAIGEIEYKLRKEENYQTRMKMGMQDLELWKKVRGMNSRWERVVLPSYLPAIDLHTSTASTSSSSSPPPGRPGSQAAKRGRESPGTYCDRRQDKVARHEVDESEDFDDKVRSADLVSDEATITPTKAVEGLQKRLDYGLISSVQGTPAKAKKDQEYQPSPVFTKSKN